MNFADVETITIPEGTVTQIECNGSVLWKYSRLPNAYQEVEYIESSGGAMMEIPYNLKGNTEMDLKILYTGSQTSAIGIMGNTAAGTGSVSNPKYIFTSSSSGAAVAYYYCSAYKAVSPTFDLVEDGVVRIETKIENGKFMIYLNGVANIQSALDEVSVTCPQNTTIFGITGGRYKDQRVYWCRFYENGTAQVDLVPCYRISDNEIGMYDLVSGSFLTNSGSGSFSKGADV